MSRHASMNRIYRLIWNPIRSAWVPVAETARGRGKSGRAKSGSTYGVVAGVSLALAPLAHASGAPPPCVAPTCGVGAVSASSHPTGGQVVSGRGSISQAGDTTTVLQSSQNLFLDWLSFNVGAQETVNFVQPSANAIAVNWCDIWPPADRAPRRPSACRSSSAVIPPRPSPATRIRTAATCAAATCTAP